MQNLEFQLELGIRIDSDTTIKDGTFLPINGAAEKIILNRTDTKPFTWIANALSAAIDSLGKSKIGGRVREEYVKKQSFDTPAMIQKLSISDASSLMVKMHHQVWHPDPIENHPYNCIKCGHSDTFDMDLSKGAKNDDVFQKLEEFGPEYFYTKEVALKYGFKYESPKSAVDGSSKDPELDGKIISKLIFRIPTLLDAINNESWYSKNEITMWDRIAFDCLTHVEIDGQKLEASFIKSIYRHSLFDQVLQRTDLSSCRRALRDDVPSLSFAVYRECPNCGEDNITLMRMSDFFTE